MKKLFFVLSVFVIVFSACGDRQAQSGLTIGVMSSTDLLPYAIARKKGFFDRHGVNVTIQKFYSANDRDAAFQSNSIDGTIIDLTGAIIQQANGIDLVVTSKEYGVFHILTNDTTIHSMSGLKGKELASSKNTVIDFVIDMALKSEGLSAKDIHRQEVNKIPVRLEMLRNHKTAATGLPEPFISIALKDGMRSIATVEELGYNVTCMVFHRNIANKKESQLKAMYAAYNEAVDYIRTHDRSDFYDILIEDLGTPEDLTEKILLPDYQKYSLPTEKDTEAVIKWLREAGLIPANYTAAQLNRQL
ncbi:MAG: ABC transporter substrate-binding protein [Prevotellaceae bacterium]|jgi:NitT/TauT family transport system substrate-binding protein|nr:ABC transporter substrate-binding protein [Prevotellaceae bacterium]